MAEAQVQRAATRQQKVENAMAKAVLQHLSKEFNKPKLYEVSITENIQPDIVGFILATKKKLFCMTVEELNSVFPEQQFLGVTLANSVGPETVHRINPFTPDDNLSTLVNKYLARHTAGAGKETVEETTVDGSGYEMYDSSDDEVYEEEKGGDVEPMQEEYARGRGGGKQVSFVQKGVALVRKKPGYFKKPRGMFQPGKKTRPAPILKRHAAGHDVTHSTMLKPSGLTRMHSVRADNNTGEGGLPHTNSTPPAGNNTEVPDILSQAIDEVDIFHNNSE